MTIQELSDILSSRQFIPHIASTRAEAREKLLSLIGEGESVGFGGSVSIKTLDVYDALRNAGHAVYWHWLASPEDSRATQVSAMTADVYLSSCNAITQSGCLVSVDGSGNRIAAQAYGPKKLVFVVSMHKLVKDVSAAIARIRTVATPMNVKRLGITDTPCANGPCRPNAEGNHICRGTVLLERAMNSHPTHVILVEEELGY